MAQQLASIFLLIIAVQCNVIAVQAQHTVPVNCVPGKAQFPNPNDRHSFYKCDAGRNPILFQCPPGTWFNPRLEVCDWDTGNNGQQGGGGNWQNGGNSGGGSSSSQIQSPDFASSGNWWKPPSTSTNTNRPPTTGVNNNNNAGTGVRPSANGWCDPNGPFSFQNTEDCSTFFICIQGSLATTYCPPQMYYSPHTFRCEGTVPRGCKLIGNSTPRGPAVEEPGNDDVWQYARFGRRQN